MVALSTLYLILCVLLVIALGITIFGQLRYAAANYPESWRRQFVLLLGHSFACGSILGVIILLRDYSGLTFWLGVVACGLVYAFVMRVFFVSNVQHVLPKRNSGHSVDDVAIPPIDEGSNWPKTITRKGDILRPQNKPISATHPTSILLIFLGFLFLTVLYLTYSNP
jgi:hypothetical protein